MRSFVARFPVFVFVGLALAVQFAMVAFVYVTVPAGLDVNEVPLAHDLFRLRVFVPFILAVIWRALGD